MGQLELDFGVAALFDYDEDGHLQVGTDAPGLDGKAGTQPAEALLPIGMYGAGLDPDKGPDGDVGLGVPLLTITVGDRRYVLPLNDPREASKVPKVKKGGRMLAGGAGEHRSFVLIDGEDKTGVSKPGSVSIFASYSKAGAKKSLALSLNVRESGEEEISLVHGDGARVTISKSGTSITAPGGQNYLDVSDDANALAGETTVQGSLTVGEPLAALPVAIGPVVAAALSALAAAVAAAPGAQGAPAAIVPFLGQLSSKHCKAT